ncbi:CobW family GTP-binding protein [Oceanibaculum indicum]|uniref:Cobalamin synthesis protein n=1 Tax=Oceanibaculum indicum P24 TaxID=1207063 RepID=K2J6R9_9PROT|nr:GTP-binding protein [Oceanibaculum indicum]EKE78756.1 cobalamin synthesis protein [Oceanibaculum indicum P24]
MSSIPVSVLTGFLGSGKTTLLSKLLRHPGMADTAVVINEFGEVGLDHLLVEKSSENMVELNSGCLCCTVRGDLVTTLRDLHIKRAKQEISSFKRLVIETTGLADPAPILHTLMTDPMLASYYRLDGVITVVDAVNGEATLDNHMEAVKQAAVADRLVLTKTDLVKDPASARDLEALERRLAQLNPAAPRLRAVQGEIEPEVLFNAGLYDPTLKTPDVLRWLKEEAYADSHAHHDHDHDHGHDHHHHHGHDHHHDVNRHDDHVRAFCIVLDRPIDAMAFSLFIEMLIATRGENLLRVKGILNIADRPDQPAVIHGVQHVFHPVAWLEAWPSEDRRSRLVFITRDVPEDDIRQLIRALQVEAQPQDVPQGTPA